MGFGYLLGGYLVVFLLKLPLAGLGIGGVALLFGYALMWWGTHRLKLFCRSFIWAEVSFLPLFLLACYRMAEDLSALFLWDLPILSGGAVDWIGLAELFLIVLMHAMLLSAVRELAMSLELKEIAFAALRNTLMVVVYALLYVLYLLPLGSAEGIKPYLGLTMTVLNIAWVLFNLFLFLTCAKDICAEGDEEIEPKRYRWELLNRIGDRFADTMKESTDRNRRDAEDYLRRRNEKIREFSEKNGKAPIQHHKKRKKK